MTEAGWYADPEGHGRGRRYWDGSQWTEHYEHPAPAQQAAPAPAPQPVVQQQAPAQQLPPAGWKDDPEGGEGLRYWDGQQWTDHYHPPRDPAPAAASSSFEPASQAFQPSTGSEPAVQAAPAAGAAGAAAAAAATPSPGSLDETQLDVRGYHGGRPEEPSAAPETEPSAADATPATPAEEAAPASAGPDLSIDYGTAGEAATCSSCGAKIRSSHKFCPACGVAQEGSSA